VQKSHQHLRALQRERDRLWDAIPTTMVMQEMPTPRPTHILLRGEYDKKGPKVQPGLPAALPPLPAHARNDRLGFAQWLVRPDHPLTARVAVNRVWQMYFGNGIVKSVEDFGSQGEWPSHPELLDWLAMEFMSPSPPTPLPQGARGEMGWDVKALHRRIVTSATYRQSSKVTPALRERDPDNRLLARGPRQRLSAEMIRDQALFASGLLVEKVGGPSVRPYQPKGLVKELTGVDEDLQDHGADLYRRSMYIHWKRTVAPPAMMAFDAANRETCVVRESRTNTPLQALNLMNDVTYVEAARALAQRVLRAGGTTVDARLTYAFRLATARPPRTAELQILRGGFERQLAHFRAHPQAAEKLLAVGESPRPTDVEAAELAAYATVASLILNLDEVITRE
jgi:hypothetical protein